MQVTESAATGKEINKVERYINLNLNLNKYTIKDRKFKLLLNKFS